MEFILICLLFFSSMSRKKGYGSTFACLERNLIKVRMTTDEVRVAGIFVKELS